MTRCTLIVIATLATVAVARLATPPQAAAAESRLVASCTSGPVADLTSDSRPVSHTRAPSAEEIAALADAATQTLRARALVRAGEDEDLGGDHIKFCDVDVSFQNALTIGPGTSGRSPGDPVTLALTLRVDGTVSAGPTAIPPDFIATSEVFAHFELEDPERRVCDDEGGCDYPKTLPKIDKCMSW